MVQRGGNGWRPGLAFLLHLRVLIEDLVGAKAKLAESRYSKERMGMVD